MRRAVVTGLNRTKVLDSATVFSGAVRIEGVHPLQFGFLRRKVRTQRRYGMRIVNPLFFYPWRAYDFVINAWQWLTLVRRYRRIMARVAADPETANYTDDALQVSAAMTDHFVDDFADKIPNTYGAPPKHPRRRRPPIPRPPLRAGAAAERLLRQHGFHEPVELAVEHRARVRRSDTPVRRSFTI